MNEVPPRPQDPKDAIRRTGPNSAEADRTYPVPPERLEAAVLAAAERLSRWSFEQGVASGERSGLRLLRTTRVFRFGDDVSVRVTPGGEGGSRLAARSSSRTGRYDLGQNPRNLRELLRAVDEELSGR